MGYLSNIKWSIEKRLSILKKSKIWKKYGSETRFHFDNPDISIGAYTYGIPNVRIYDLGIKLYIGKFCSIADNVEILIGGAHYTEWGSTYPFYTLHKDIFSALPETHSPESKNTIIGNDVWIGNGVTILSGKTIGNGAVVGAGAVVSKNIPPYAIAVGNPIKIIRYRFDENTISKLQASEWWNLPIEVINQLLPYIKDVTIFLQKIEEYKSSSIFATNSDIKSGGGKTLIFNILAA